MAGIDWPIVSQHAWPAHRDELLSMCTHIVTKPFMRLKITRLLSAVTNLYGFATAANIATDIIDVHYIMIQQIRKQTAVFVLHWVKLPIAV